MAKITVNTLSNKSTMYELQVMAICSQLKHMDAWSLEDTGRYKQIALPEGILLDLFMPDAKDYYRQLAIRTGSSWFSKNVLAVAWTRLGWCGTQFGLRKMSDCVLVRTADLKPKWKLVNTNGVKPPVWESEAHFFEWLRIKWVEPKNRI